MFVVLFLLAMAAMTVADLPAYYTFAPRPDQHDRFDQQASFYNSKSKGVIWLIGGNGAGTTEVALAKVAKFVMETEPPRKDTPFWIISESYEMVCKAAWKEKLSPRSGHGHIPASEIDWDRIRWYRPNQEWPFEVPLKAWPSRPGRNWTLVFKSYGQGRQQMQAEAIGGFLFVEQFPWGLLEEVLRGCREYDFPGSKLCEFTPIDPNLSVEIEEMVEHGPTPDNPEPGKRYLPRGWEIWRANTQCAMEAGHVQSGWFEQFFGMVPEEMKLTRMTGQFASYEGAIYKGFEPRIHLVGDEVINFPPNIFHRRGIDWGSGPENAFCCLWLYRNGLGQWFVYDEYYSTDQLKTTIDHLCEVQDRWPWPENNPHYGSSWADPSEPDYFRMAAALTQYRPDYEPMSLSRASNSVLPGIEHVQSLLKPQIPVEVLDPETGRIKTVLQPKLFIHRTNCPHLARQMRTYRWLKSNDIGLNPRDARREPLKKDDHAVDGLRYPLFSEACLTGGTPGTVQRDRSVANRGVKLAGRRRA